MNIAELQEFISEQLHRLAENQMTPAAANAAGNLSGKLLATVKMQMDHDKMLGVPPDTDFFETNEAIKKLTNGKIKRAKYNKISGEIQN